MLKSKKKLLSLGLLLFVGLLLWGWLRILQDSRGLEVEPMVSPNSSPPSALEDEGPVSLRSADSKSAFMEAEPEPLLSWATDTSVPLDARKERIVQISHRKNLEAFEMLRAVADETIYLRYTAIEAMGHLTGSPAEAAAADYLEERLTSPDAQIAKAAIRGLRQLQGARSVPKLAGAFQDNYTRRDGHEEGVCTALVLQLQWIASEEAVPALVVELNRSGKEGWSLEYGSNVLSALGATDTEAGRSAAAAYARFLQSQLPDDALAKSYYEKKIEEAQQVAGQNI